MLANTNTWKRISYTLWAPIYDLIVTPLFNQRRQRSIQLLDLKPGERVLLVGAGTGLDLDFLPNGLAIVATDLTPAMIARLQTRAQRLRMTADARVMDGQALEFSNESFDAAILHLIVAVIPDPVKCLSEVARVLRPGGRAVAVGAALSGGPPHRSVRAELPHTALTSGAWRRGGRWDKGA